MADDDVPKDREREPAPEPKRPFTLQDARARADQVEQEARREREQRTLMEHKTDIEHLLDIRGIHDPETRSLATGFIVSNIAATGFEFERIAPHDRLDIAIKSIDQAHDEEEKRRRTPETDEVARQSGASPEQERQDGAQSKSAAKEEEPERESQTGKEITDAGASRIARLRNHGPITEQWEKASQRTVSREPHGRGRE